MKLRPAREKGGSECLTGVCREVHGSAHRWPGRAGQVDGEPSHKERTRQYKWNSGAGRLGGQRPGGVGSDCGQECAGQREEGGSDESRFAKVITEK